MAPPLLCVYSVFFTHLSIRLSIRGDGGERRGDLHRTRVICTGPVSERRLAVMLMDPEAAGGGSGLQVVWLFTRCIRNNLMEQNVLSTSTWRLRYTSPPLHFTGRYEAAFPKLTGHFQIKITFILRSDGWMLCPEVMSSLPTSYKQCTKENMSNMVSFNLLKTVDPLGHRCQNTRPAGRIRPTTSFDVAPDGLKNTWSPFLKEMYEIYPVLLFWRFQIKCI